MADAQEMKRAQDTFAMLCRMLDGQNWKYDKDDAELKIECGAVGEDLPMPVTIKVRPDRQIVLLLSYLPIEVPDDKRLEVAAAISIVNYRLINGCFEFNISNGRLYFRMTNSFMDSTLSEETFRYMLFVSLQTIDDYNDKLEALVNGKVDISAFMK